MTTQLRYQTLVTNIGRVYASDDGGRTPYLQRGLDEIMNVVKPSTVNEWGLVKTDSDRLLKVWCVKENSSLAAVAVKEQIHDILVELSTAAASETKPISLEVSDTIHHVNDPIPRMFVNPPRQQFQPAYFKPSQGYSAFEEEDDEDFHSVVINPSSGYFMPATATTAVKALVPAPVPVPVSAPAPAPAPVKAPVPAPVPVPVSAPVKAPVPASVPVLSLSEIEDPVEEEVEEAEEEVEEEVEEAEEEVEEAVEEVKEEEEAVEEEEGLEVEQVTIRGRTYWLDSNSGKLYANAEGDEVGDEVGAMVNGKPVFLAA